MYRTLTHIAGQFEYYSGHAAMLENTIITSPSVFLIVVDATEYYVSGVFT